MRLEAKTEKETHIPVGDVGQGRSSFEEFFRRYKTDNMYCVSEVFGRAGFIRPDYSFSISNTVQANSIGYFKKRRTL